MRAVSVRSLSAGQARRCYVVQSARVPFGITTRSNGVGAVSVPAQEALERSTLESGVQVLSVDMPSATTSLSLFVQAGSRYEDRQTKGAASFLKHLAYKGSADKSALRLVRDLEHVGASLSVSVDREHVCYHVTGLRPSSTQDLGLAVMAETLRAVTQPTLLEYEVEQVRPLVLHDARVRAVDSARVLRDRVHAEHFADSGLAHAPCASERNATLRSAQELHRFVSERFVCSGMRVVGVGIEHATLMGALSSLFTAQGLTRRAHDFELRDKPRLDATSTMSQTYHRVTRPTLLREEEEGPAHVTVSYHGVSLRDPKDLLALEILAEVLGCGLVSSGGLSSTRHAVSRLSGVGECASFVDAYSDAGLFGVAAASPSHNAAQLCSSVQDALRDVTKNITPEEHTRATMAMRARLLAMRGAHVAHVIMNHNTTCAQRAELLATVTRQDVMRVAQDVLQTPPVVAARGNVQGLRL